MDEVLCSLGKTRILIDPVLKLVYEKKTTIYLSHEARAKAKASIFCRLVIMRKFMHCKGAQCSTDEWPFYTRGTLVIFIGGSSHLVTKLFRPHLYGRRYPRQPSLSRR